MTHRTCLDAALACALVAGAILLFCAMTNLGLEP